MSLQALLRGSQEGSCDGFAAKIFFTVKILANLRLTVNFFSSFLKKKQLLRLGIFLKPTVKIQLLGVIAIFVLQSNGMDPLTLIGYQDRISAHNINTTSNRKVMRKKEKHQSGDYKLIQFHTPFYKIKL